MKAGSIAVTLAAMALAGCATMTEAPPTGPCRVTQAMHQRYAGATFRERLRRTIQRDANAPVARILRDGVPATMDFRPERIDIHLDDGGRIDGLRCG